MPGPAGSSFSGGRGAGNVVWIELPNKAMVSGRIKQHAAGLELREKAIMANLAEELVFTAKDLVAIDSGKTKDSIRHEQRGKDRYVVVDRHGDKPEVPIYLEIGTHKMAARPFLVPAANLVLAGGGELRAVRGAGGLLGQTPGRK